MKRIQGKARTALLVLVILLPATMYGHRTGMGGDTERTYAAVRSAAQSTGPTPSPQSETPTQLPEGYVINEEFKDQFTVAIPKGWMAYDQSRAFKGVSGRWNMIFFLASTDFATDSPGPGMISVQVLRKVDSGEIPSFFIQRLPADKGMSCAGFSEKAEKKLLDLVRKDSVLKETSEPPHATPAAVGGCKGLRITGKGQPKGGPPWVVDVYAASDGETLYLFSLRNLAENYAKNTDIFQKAVSTAKFSAAK